MDHLIAIASNIQNFPALLLLGSDKMKQPPFTSGGDRDKLSDAQRAVSRVKEVNIAGHRGGITTIFSLLRHFPALQALGFSSSDALRIAGHTGGSNNIQAVLAHHETLMKKRFTNEHILTIGVGTSGNTGIDLVTAHFDELNKMNFSHDQIAQIAKGNSVAPKHVELVLKYGNALLRNGYTHQWILQALFSRKGTAEKETLLRRCAEPRWTVADQAAPYQYIDPLPAADETSAEPFSLASPPDARELQKVLQDEGLRAALGLADQNTQPFSFLGEGASHEQAAQVVRELR